MLGSHRVKFLVCVAGLPFPTGALLLLTSAVVLNSLLKGLQKWEGTSVGVQCIDAPVAWRKKDLFGFQTAVLLNKFAWANNQPWMGSWTGIRSVWNLEHRRASAPPPPSAVIRPFPKPSSVSGFQEVIGKVEQRDGIVTYREKISCLCSLYWSRYWTLCFSCYF